MLTYDRETAERRMGAYVDFLMAAYDMDAHELADLIGVDRGHMTRFINSDFEHKNGSILASLIRLTGISASWLFAERTMMIIVEQESASKLRSVMGDMKGVIDVLDALADKRTEESNAIRNQSRELDRQFARLDVIADELEKTHAKCCEGVL